MLFAYGLGQCLCMTCATLIITVSYLDFMFAWCLFLCITDVFCTRLTPSNTFDLLASTFNYGLLLTVVVALIAGNIVTGLMASRKALRAQWA